MNDINPPGIQVEINPYDRQLAKCLAAGASAADATEAVLRSYVDGTPKLRGKQKVSRATLDAAFWSSATLGYDPESDLRHKGQSRLGFEFDDVARRQSIAALREQFPRRLHQAPATFPELYESTCNSTPASQQLYRKALGQLVQEREPIIVGAEGEVRRSPNTIRGTDIVKPPPQRTLSFA